MAVDVDGDVFVTDAGNNRCEIFDQNGVFVDKFGSTGSGDGQFEGPEDLAFDGLGGLYIIDGLNYRVEKFVFPATPTVRNSWGKLKARFR